MKKEGQFFGAFSHLQENYDNQFNLNISLPPLNSSIFCQENLNSNTNFLFQSSKLNRIPVKRTDDIQEM